MAIKPIPGQPDIDDRSRYHACRKDQESGHAHMHPMCIGDASDDRGSYNGAHAGQEHEETHADRVF